MPFWRLCTGTGLFHSARVCTVEGSLSWFSGQRTLTRGKSQRSGWDLTGASPVLTKSSKAQQIPALICCRSCALSSGLPCPGAAPVGGPWGHSFSQRSACALLLCEAQQKQRSPFIGLTVPAQLLRFLSRVRTVRVFRPLPAVKLLLLFRRTLELARHFKLIFCTAG